MSKITPADKMRICPVTTTVAIIGGKWKPRLLWMMRHGAASFGDLRRGVRASERMVSKSLRELEQAGIIERSAHAVGRVRTTRYAYSDYGRTLIPALDALGHWGIQHMRASDETQGKQSAPGQR